MLQLQSFKTFKALLEDIQKNFGDKEIGEAKFARKVLRDYGFSKNYSYGLLPFKEDQEYAPIILVAHLTKEGNSEIGMYSYDANAPIDIPKSNLIMEWADINVEGKGNNELHFFTTNSWNDITDDAFARFNTHKKIWIRKHWIDDY